MLIFIAKWWTYFSFSLDYEFIITYSSNIVVLISAFDGISALIIADVFSLGYLRGGGGEEGSGHKSEERTLVVVLVGRISSALDKVGGSVESREMR